MTLLAMFRGSFGGILEQNSGMDSRDSVNIIGNNENNASRQHFLGTLLQRDYRKDLVNQKEKVVSIAVFVLYPDLFYLDIVRHIPVCNFKVYSIVI